jgi:hypothetical protein
MLIFNKKLILFKQKIKYQDYLKNLNLKNILKNRNKILLNNICILKTKKRYLLNLNLKNNFFLNPKYKIKNNLFYTISKENQKKNIIINFKKLNFYFLKLFNYLLLKKYNFFKKKKNYIKNFNFTLNKKKYINKYLEGFIIRKNYKKNIIVSFNPLIKTINYSKFYKLKIKVPLNNFSLIRKLYNKTKLKNLIKKFKKKKKKFKILKNTIIKKKKLKLNFSRIDYVSDLQKQINFLILIKKKIKNK